MNERRFDAVLFDAGGVLALPDPTVLAPLLAYFGLERARAASPRPLCRNEGQVGRRCVRVELARANNHAYVAAVDVDLADRDEAAGALDRTRYHHTWRWAIPESCQVLDRLGRGRVPMGVASNASGQIEAMLRRDIAQVGPGDHVEMRVIVDSHVVGVAKPDPAIFDHALPAFSESRPGGSPTSVTR